MTIKTKGPSPKVIADAVVSVLSFVLTAGVIQIDPVIAAAISKVLGTVAAVIAGPGDFVLQSAPTPDSALASAPIAAAAPPAAAVSPLASEKGQVEPLSLLIYVVVFVVIVLLLLKLLAAA